MSVVPVFGELEPSELECGVDRIVASGDIDAVVRPSGSAPDDEVPADFRTSALEVAAEIQALASPGRDNHVTKEFHVCPATLIAEVSSAGLDEALRERCGHAGDDFLATAAGTGNRTRLVLRLRGQWRSERYAVRQRAHDPSVGRVCAPGIGLVQLQRVLWNSPRRLRAASSNRIGLRDKRLRGARDLE